MYTIKTRKMLLIVVLPVIVHSTVVQSSFSKMAQKLQLKYDHTFPATSRLQCGRLCNCDYFYFENETCYAAGYPMRAENSEIVARYYVSRRIEEVKETCMGYGQSFILDAIGSCVWIPTVKLNWTDAQQFCKARGGDLIIPKYIGSETTQGLMDFIRTLTLNQGAGIWVGASDLGTEGDWKWADGASLSRSDPAWANGNPDNYRGQEDCGLSNPGTNYELNDGRCDKVRRFACGMWI